MGDEVAADYWRVAIVEDHLLQRTRTESVLDDEPGLRVVRTAESLPELMTWLAGASPSQRPHLIVLDLMVDRGPSVDPDLVRRLVDAGARVLVMSAMASAPLVRAVLAAGVAGIISKRDSESDLVEAAWAAIRRENWITAELAAVMAGDADRPTLSDQEERALALYASGLTLDAVAASIGVQSGTAKKYINRVKEKYEAVGRPARTKVDLNREALRDGFLMPDPPGPGAR